VSIEIPNLAVRATRRVQRSTVRYLTCPFVDRSDRPLIVHCGHHKAGTVWFRRVLLDLAVPYGLRYRSGTGRPVTGDTDIAFFTNTRRFDRSVTGPRRFRGSHVVRDPRDLIVSGYEYHLVTKEAWALEPDDAYGGRSYQDHLRSLDEHRGISAEIEWFLAATAVEMRQWDYGQSEFLELRLEDVLADEHGSFDRLFRWYEFDDRAIERGHGIVERRSRRSGGARKSHPIRSSTPGEWIDRLSADHIDSVKRGLGTLLVDLGYETGPDW